MDKHYQYIGGQGAGGMGYGAPASVGAALANRKYGRLSINIQTDGDFNYAPGVFWTAAHHRIPLLTIMHNNRGYHQEVMFVEQQASLHNRGQERAHIGTKRWDPNINYANIAKGYGLYAEGPIGDPKDLVPALKRGFERVKKGEPVLLDVVTQPRWWATQLCVHAFYQPLSSEGWSGLLSLPRRQTSPFLRHFSKKWQSVVPRPMSR